MRWRPGLLLALSLVLTAAEQPNVLLVVVDDLKPDLGCYGATHAQTPALDAFAATAVRFERAYCAQAVCGPSRASLLTGCRPDTTGVIDLGTTVAAGNPALTTLPRHARSQGYTTVSLGKVFHHAKRDDPAAWDEVAAGAATKSSAYLDPATLASIDAAKAGLAPAAAKAVRGPAFEFADRPDADYPDHQLATTAVATIPRLAAAGKPWLLAVGFWRPHLPWVVPKPWADRFPAAQAPLSQVLGLPSGAPDFAGHAFEIGLYAAAPKSGPVPEAQARELVRAYQASVAFADAQIGRVLAALDASGQAANTIVVVWGDHGFHLGDHGLWSKHTQYEQANRLPLLLRGPGVVPAVVAEPVESIGVFPTVCRLAGLPVPAQCEGGDLLTGRTGLAFHQYPRDRTDAMGYAVRDGRFRLIRWIERPTGRELARELYDYDQDPTETANRAGDPALAADEARLVQALAPRIAAAPRTSLKTTNAKDSD